MMKNCLLFLAFSCAILANAQPDFIVEKQLTGSASATGDQVGYATHMYKNKFIVGAPRHDKDETGATATDVGAAYVHERSATGVWTEYKLSAPYGDPTDIFGTSVAISDSFAIVGAPWHDYQMFFPTVYNNIGAAFIYKKNSSTGDWEFFQKLSPHGVGPSENIYNPDDWFGQSVSISGNTIVVGALYHDYDDVNTFMSACGAAFVFEWDPINLQFEYKTKLFVPFADRADDDAFGTSAQVQGNTIVVGAPGQDKDELGVTPMIDAGAAYIFEKDGSGNWNYTAKITAPNMISLGSQREAGAFFGLSVAVNGIDIVVGAPFQDHGNGGAFPFRTDQGCAYTFAKPFGGWVYGQQFYCPTSQVDTYYGSAVGIHNNNMVVGAYAHNMAGGPGADYGRVDLYRRAFFGDLFISSAMLDGYSVSPNNTLDYLGKSVSVYGNKFIAGATNYDLDAAGDPLMNGGAAFVFCGPLQFSSQPVDATICVGDTTVFIAHADNAVQVQWYVSVDGIVSTPLVNNAFYSGVNNDTLKVSNALGSMDDLIYFCTITNDCGPGTLNSDQAVLHVNPLPSITFTLADDVCADVSTVSLSAFPSGGSFSGVAVSGTSFTPSVAGAGTHNIVYTYTDMSTGCTATDVESIGVHGPPAVSFTVADDQVCSTEAPFTLVGGTPAGGVYSGTGVSGGTSFNPAVSGAGTMNILYTYTDAFGCINSANDAITVTNGPIASLAISPDEVCSSGGTVSLDGGFPLGGIFTGTGVTGTSTFDPAIAGIGTTTIVYTYTDGVGCSDSASATITVTAGPVMGLILPFTSICNDDAAVVLSGGTPAGGTFSGTGVSAGSFDPAVAGAGNFTITYSYFESGSGCTGIATQSITVDNCSAIGEMTGENGISVYPNPASNLLNIVSKEAGLQKITLWNEMGQQVLQHTNTGSGAITIHTGQLSTGIYVLEVQTGKGNTRHRLVVSH